MTATTIAAITITAATTTMTTTTSEQNDLKTIGCDLIVISLVFLLLDVSGVFRSGA